MVQTRSSTRNSLESEDNNTNQENAHQHLKPADESQLSEVAKGKRPVKRKHSDGDSEHDEKKHKKKTRTPRGGQRKNYIFHIPIPNARDLEIIRQWFERPQDRQCWGVIRDHFSALETLWGEAYGWDLPTTRTEMDYGLLVQTIREYRGNLPRSNGKTCDRCAARGQATCCHNGFDKCKGCVRNSVPCTITDKQTGKTTTFLGTKYENEPRSDPGAIVQWWTLQQQPRKLPAKKTGNEHFKDVTLGGQLGETRAATARPSIQTPRHGFARRTRGNAAMTNSRQPPVQQLNPTSLFVNSPYANNSVTNTPLYQGRASFGVQQGLTFDGHYQTHPEYPVPPDSTGFNLHFPQYDQGNNGIGLPLSHNQDMMGNSFSYDPRVMMKAILNLRAEVQRLGGDTSIAADLVVLAPIQRAPATLDGPAPFPSRRRSQFANTTAASTSNSVTSTSQLFEDFDDLEDLTTPESGFLDPNTRHSTPTSAELEYNIQNQTTGPRLFSSTAYHPAPTSAPLLNNIPHPTPTQTLFPSDLQDFQLESEYTSFPSNGEQFGQPPSGPPVDPSILHYSHSLGLDTGNTLARSRLESYDVNGEATSALQQKETIRRSRLSVSANPELGGNGAVADGEPRDVSLQSTKERLGEHVEEVLRENASQDPFEVGWTVEAPAQFGPINTHVNDEGLSVLDDQSRHDPFAVPQLDGTLYGLSDHLTF